MPFKYNSLSGKLDLVNPKLDSPLQFKGTITINTDFPLIADVDNGWFYTILADVTDDAGVTYTNTGQSFDLGDEVAWDGSAWVVMGNENVYARLDGTNMPFTGNVGIGTTDFANGRPLRIHSSTANSGVRITNSTTGTGVNKGLELSLSNNIGYLALYENADLKIYTNNSYRASFLAGGDFSVEKDIYMSNNYAKFIQGGSDQYEQYFDGTNQRYELTSGAFKFNQEMFVDGQSITYGATGGSPSNTDNYHYQDALVWHHDSHNKDGAFVITLPSVGNSMSVFKIRGFNYGHSDGGNWEAIVSGY